jgi:hypothetical protein
MKHEDYYISGHRGNKRNVICQNSLLHVIGGCLLFLLVCLKNSLTGARRACSFLANQKHCGCFMPVSDDFSKILRVPSVKNELLFQNASEMKVSRPANCGQRRKDCGGKKNNHTIENMFAATLRAILFASPSFCLKMNDKKQANLAYFPIPS